MSDPALEWPDSPAGTARDGQTPLPQVYLDYAASTPCDPAVAALMRRIAVHDFANPSSSHRAGQRATQYIETAREQVAAAINALPEEIVFTSGATESNNLAILGVAAEAQERGNPRRRIVTLGIEHPSVLGPCQHLSKRGFPLAIAPVRGDGLVDLDALAATLGDDTLLLSIQAANNEIGTIQPLAAATRIAHDRGALVHSDATQALGKIPFDVEFLGLDFASFSAHKCYGPKGVGALWVCGSPARSPIAPLFFGGGHERNLRPGTSDTSAIAGFGEAARLAAERLSEDARRIATLRDYFEALVQRQVENVTLNGALDYRLPGSSSLTFEGIDAEALIARIPELALSTASACHSGTPEPSHVLRAIGLSAERAYATLRVALGRTTAHADVEYSACRVGESARMLRATGGEDNRLLIPARRTAGAAPPDHAAIGEGNGGAVGRGDGQRGAGARHDPLSQRWHSSACATRIEAHARLQLDRSSASSLPFASGDPDR